jgi:hypothetical protein
MIETDHIKKTLEHYRNLRNAKIEELKPQLDEIRGYELLIRKLADDLNEPANVETINVATATAPGSTTLVAPKNGAGRRTLKPDEFFQMSQSEAARAYLKMVGHSISMDELVSALQDGGAKVGGVDPKRTLMVSLKANPKKEFVWPNKDHIGLAEFYQKRK